MIATVLSAQSAIADPLYIVRPSIGSGKTGVLPQNAFTGKPAEQAEKPLTLSVPAEVVVQAGTPAVIEATVVNAVGNVSFRLVGTLPSGLHLDAATGRVTGAITEAGTYGITLEAVDLKGRTATAVVSLVVEAVAPTGPISADWPSVVGGFTTGVEVAYHLPVSNTYGDVVFSLVSGELPTGLWLDPTGWIRGVPTVQQIVLGTISVTDESGRVVSKNLRMGTVWAQ